jgi:hypothetical protein
VGVAWELVGLTMRQMVVKWNTTGEWRVAGIGVRSECGTGGRYGAQWADRGWWETGGLDVV